MDDAPDPLETVTLLKSDFDLLQSAATAANEDYASLLELLCITPPPARPRARSCTRWFSRTSPA